MITFTLVFLWTSSPVLTSQCAIRSSYSQTFISLNESLKDSIRNKTMLTCVFPEYKIRIQKVPLYNCKLCWKMNLSAMVLWLVLLLMESIVVVFKGNGSFLRRPNDLYLLTISSVMTFFIILSKAWALSRPRYDWSREVCSKIHLNVIRTWIISAEIWLKQ